MENDARIATLELEGICDCAHCSLFCIPRECRISENGAALLSANENSPELLKAISELKRFTRSASRNGSASYAERCERPGVILSSVASVASSRKACVGDFEACVRVDLGSNARTRAVSRYDSEWRCWFQLKNKFTNLN